MRQQTSWFQEKWARDFFYQLISFKFVEMEDAAGEYILYKIRIPGDHYKKVM
jgi:hypothetical protein